MGDFANQPETNKRVVNWKARARKRGEKEQEREDIGLGHCCVLSYFSPFFRSLREGRKKKRGDKKEQKTHFPSAPMGALQPAVGPYSCNQSDLSTAGVMATELLCQWPRCPVMPAPSHT